MNEISIIDKGVMEAPLSLLKLSKSAIEYADSYLPYSIGFEIECSKKYEFDLQSFKDIPNILDVNCDCSEQRFRIPSGLNGLICLWQISKNLNKNSILNLESGIHYHVDMTDVYSTHINQTVINPLEKEIIEELETWEYVGNYNRKGISICGLNHNWIRFQSCFKTMEVRIGEMTFNYNLLLKRILSCTKIAKLIKESDIDNYKLIILNNKLKKLREEVNKEEEIVVDDLSLARLFINSKIVK